MRQGACWWVLAMIGCGGAPGGAVVSASIEDLVWGGSDCRTSRECASGICSTGTCMGYLGAATEEARETIGPTLSQAEARGQGEGLSQALQEVLESPGSDEFLRSRAADAFRWLSPERGGEVLRGLERDASEPVRFFAARARWVRGDAAARDLLQEFARHPSEAVRMLASRALEARAPSQKGSQGPISQ